MADAEIDPAALVALLGDRFGAVSAVEVVRGGAWSAVYRVVAGGRPLAVKLGRHRDDYERDALAATWRVPGAPVPTVREVGDAFGGSYAVLDWVDGDAFDGLPPARFARACDAVLRAYEALATMTPPGTGFGIWVGPSGDAPHPTWTAFLTSVPARDDDRLRGWRERLDRHPEARRVFDAAQSDLERLAASVCEERAVNHGDPLQGNIRIGPDDEITALLDWGVSVAGDPLYDLAMLLLCLPWQPSIDPARVRAEAVRRAGTTDVHERLLASMLHIGLSALQYQAFAGLTDDLTQTTAWIDTRFEAALDQR